MQRLPVLVTGEDANLAEYIARDVDARGYRAFVATSVADTLRLVAQRAFSLIVADHLGPHERFPYRWPMLRLLARLTPRVPVLALSMSGDVPKSANLVAVVRLPDYSDDLAKGLKRYILPAPEPSRDPLLARYLAAIWETSLDEGGQVVLEAMKAGWSSAAIYEDLFAAALYEVGEWWASSSCSVADEHGARVITERLMASVSAGVERQPPNGRGIVIACVEGERHELGARMAADMFTWDGWMVILLGADTPAGDVIGEAARRKADVVGLSATMQPSWEEIRSEIQGLRAVGTKAIIVGGQAFRSLDIDAVAALGATARADRALSAVQMAGGLV